MDPGTPGGKHCYKPRYRNVLRFITTYYFAQETCRWKKQGRPYTHTFEFSMDLDKMGDFDECTVVNLSNRQTSVRN